MVFSIVIDPPALKELKKIKKGVPQVFSSIIKSIDALAKAPLSGKPLQGNKKGCYSLRDGDYRVIYEIHLASFSKINLRKRHMPFPLKNY